MAETTYKEHQLRRRRTADVFSIQYLNTQQVKS